MNIMKNNDVKVKLDIPYTQKDFFQSKPSLEELKSNIHHNDDSISISSEAKALLAEDKLYN